MRDFMSPTTKHITSAIQHPSNIKGLITTRRGVIFSVAAVFLIAGASVLFIARSAAQPTRSDAVVTDTKITTDAPAASSNDQAQPVADGSQGGNTDMNTSSNNSSSSTSVTVNNQQIPVPENGSVSKTVSNGNGTTTVNITSNSNSDGSSSGSTISSVNVNTNTHNRTTQTNVSRSTSSN